MADRSAAAGCDESTAMLNAITAASVVAVMPRRVCESMRGPIASQTWGGLVQTLGGAQR